MALITISGTGQMLWSVPPEPDTDLEMMAPDTGSSYNLRLVGELSLGSYTREVRVRGNTAVVGADHRVVIIDVSNPAMPVFQGLVATALSPAPFGICLVDNLAYVVEAVSSANSFDTGSLEVVDFSDPTRPHVLGSLRLPGGAFAVAVADQKAYVIRRSWRGSSALEGRLEIIDASDPSQLKILSGLDLQGDPTGILLDGSNAYVPQEIYSFEADRWIGGYLDIINLTDDYGPYSVSQMAFANALWGMDLWGDQLVLGGNRWMGQQFASEIIFLEVAQPTQPQVQRTVPWDTFVGPIHFNAGLMWLSEQLAGRLSVFNPQTAPLTRLASCSVLSGALIFFDVQGTRAYAANYERGLQIFELTGPPVNQPPVADGSATPSPVISGDSSTAPVTLNGSRSFDPDEDMLQYAWFSTLGREPSTFLATGEIAVVALPVGVHTLALVVSDGLAASTNTVTVEVLTPIQGIQRLLSLVDVEIRNHPRPQALKATLHAALNSIRLGHVLPAAKQLRAFQNLVHVRVTPVDPWLAELLIQEAQHISEAFPPAPEPPQRARNPIQ